MWTNVSGRVAPAVVFYASIARVNGSVTGLYLNKAGVHNKTTPPPPRKLASAKSTNTEGAGVGSLAQRPAFRDRVDLPPNGIFLNLNLGEIIFGCLSEGNWKAAPHAAITTIGLLCSVASQGLTLPQIFLQILFGRPKSTTRREILLFGIFPEIFDFWGKISTSMGIFCYVFHLKCR